MRCLLDKVVARRILECLLKLAEGRPQSDEELFSLDLFERAKAQAIGLFVVPPTAHILDRLAPLPRYASLIQLFRTRTQVTWPARYSARWARRLRDFGFTREDAAVLALATFGTDEMGTVLGMNYVATFDQPLIQNWTAQQVVIHERLTAMQRDLPAPYRDAQLPLVLRPEFIAPS